LEIEIAERLDWTYALLNDIVNGRRNISADPAHTLGEALKTGPEFWLNLQWEWNLWHAMDAHRKVTPLMKVG
jgi:antitoxin HigA-1